MFMHKYIRFMLVVTCTVVTATPSLQQTYSEAKQLLAQLSLEEKIGQLFMAAVVIDPESNDVLMQNLPYRIEDEYIHTLITQYHISGLVYLGSTTPEKQIARTIAYQRCASENNTIPLLIAQDLEWGLAMRLHNTIAYPHNMALGAVSDTGRNSALIYELGKEIGRQMQIMGIHMNFAPVADVNNNPANPIINDRSFGADPERVSKKVVAYMRGLHDAGILACAKHFPGHGDTQSDSHHELPCIPHDKHRLHTIELAPFKAAIAKEIPAIMVAHLQIPAYDPTPHTPATLSHSIVTKLLKEELNFTGLVITDGLGMQGVPKYAAPGELELRALQAGNDILLCPIDIPKAIRRIKTAIADGQLSEKILDAHVLKILQAKIWAFSQRTAPKPESTNVKHLHTEHAYALKRALYRAAVTIARDNAHLIPYTNHIKQHQAPHNNSHQNITENAHTTARTIYLQLGRIPENHFKKTLVKTIPCTCYTVENETSYATTIPALGSSDTLIITVHGMSRFPQNNFGITSAMQNYIKSLARMAKNSILVLFGNAYSARFFQDIGTVIVAYDDNPDAQEAAADIITGALHTTATLPI